MNIKNFIFSSPASLIAPGAMIQAAALILNPFPGKRFIVKRLLWQIDIQLRGAVQTPVPIEQNTDVWIETALLNRDTFGIVNELDVGSRIIPLAVYAATTDTVISLSRPGQYDFNIELLNYLTVNTYTDNRGINPYVVRHSYVIEIHEGGAQ